MKFTITKAERDALAPHFQNEYVEKDGAFALKIEGPDGWSFEDVAGLKRTLSDRTEKHRTAQEKLTLYGEQTPEKVRELIAELTTLRESGSGSKASEAREKAIEKQLRDAHAVEIDRERNANKALMAEIEEIVVDSSLTRAIADAKGSVKGLLPQLKAVTKMVKVDGKWRSRIMGPDGNPLLTRKAGETGDMQPDEYIDVILRKDPELAPLFTARAAQGDGGGQGAGNRGGGAGNGVDPKLSGTDLLKQARSGKAKATA